MQKNLRFDLRQSVFTPLRVRWGECDPAGIAYQVNYFDWFVEGRTDYLRERVDEYRRLFEGTSIVLVATEAYCTYQRTLIPGDQIAVCTVVSSFSRTKLQFHYAIVAASAVAELQQRVSPVVDGDFIYARGYTTHPWMDMQQNRAVDLRKHHPQLWERLSAAIQVTPVW
ncbi:MAG: acyl-CoA thioesterase [Firmicutes bacterium]|nr:acyl-CoA thioesterase [Bacillota bacterium]